MRYEYWTPSELAYLREHYAETPNELLGRVLNRAPRNVAQKARKLGLSKSAQFLARQSGRFEAGLVPWNKGRPGTTGTQDACRATQFKPGRPAELSANYRPIGSVRAAKGGYLEQKITDDRSLYPARRWVPVHRLVWDREVGPIPPGHIVVFKPGMLTTDLKQITPDRLECISRAENMARNTVHRYGKDIAQLIQLRAAITRQLNKKEKELHHEPNH